MDNANFVYMFYGFLAAWLIVVAYVVFLAMREGRGNGEFEASTGARYSSSFPSGHAIETFAIASIFAHEYPHNRWVKILVYAYAGGVVGARLAANMHFPGDVMAGGAMGEGGQVMTSRSGSGRANSRAAASGPGGRCARRC